MSPVTRQPAMRSFMRFSERRNVDFPQPDGPMSAVILFLSIFKETFFSAW